jgi:hypothetical protein
MEDKPRGVGLIIGLSAVGPPRVGGAGLVGALFPFFSGDYTGAGLLLIASAIAFGSLALATLGRWFIGILAGPPMGARAQPVNAVGLRPSVPRGFGHRIGRGNLEWRSPRTRACPVSFKNMATLLT